MTIFNSLAADEGTQFQALHNKTRTRFNISLHLHNNLNIGQFHFSGVISVDVVTGWFGYADGIRFIYHTSSASPAATRFKGICLNKTHDVFLLNPWNQNTDDIIFDLGQHLGFCIKIIMLGRIHSYWLQPCI